MTDCVPTKEIIGAFLSKSHELAGAAFSIVVQAPREVELRYGYLDTGVKVEIVETVEFLLKVLKVLNLLLNYC